MLHSRSSIPYKRPVSLSNALQNEKNIFYVGIGSNMVVSKLKERSESEAIISAQPVVLHGYRLAFNVRGFPPLEPVYASIEPDADTSCHGCLYEMTADAYRKLWMSEGGHVSPPVYQEVMVEVYPYNCKTPVLAVALQCNPHHKLPTDHAPSKRYMSMLICGANQLGIQKSYIEYLRSIPTYEVSNVLRHLSLSLLFSHMTLMNLHFPIPFGAFRLFFQKYLYNSPASAPIQRRIYDCLAIALLLWLPGTYIGAAMRCSNALLGVPAIPSIMKSAMTRDTTVE